MVQSIKAEQARALIASGEVDVIDVREPAEWRTGHIAGARHVPLSRFRASPKAYLTRESVVFVCAAGVRSNMAAQLAAAGGLKNAYNLEGGTKAWTRAGLALELPTQQATG